MERISSNIVERCVCLSLLHSYVPGAANANARFANSEGYAARGRVQGPHRCCSALGVPLAIDKHPVNITRPAQNNYPLHFRVQPASQAGHQVIARTWKKE